MAEFCLDCYNKYFADGDERKEDSLTVSAHLELCEGCGEMKQVVLNTSTEAKQVDITQLVAEMNEELRNLSSKIDDVYAALNEFIIAVQKPVETSVQLFADDTVFETVEQPEPIPERPAYNGVKVGDKVRIKKVIDADSYAVGDELEVLKVGFDYIANGEKVPSNNIYVRTATQETSSFIAGIEKPYAFLVESEYDIIKEND